MAGSLIGSRIRERREALGLKQSAVAKTCGISPSYLNLIEHNRRGIGGRVLQALAAALKTDAARLGEGGQSDLARILRLAASEEKPQAEEARLEEFITRFPGWAAVLASLRQRRAQLEQIVDTLSDRLAHDPYLSESLHEMLSSVTAIHSTSGILAQSQDMEPLQRRRFHNNLFDESARLSDLSQDLVHYFDHLAEGEQNLSTPQDELVAFLGAANYSFPTLEPGGGETVEGVMSRLSPPGLSSAASLMISVALARLRRDAARLPQSALAKAIGDQPPEPYKLAQQLNLPLDLILRRLTFFPGLDRPFGMIICDGTGATLFRKPLAGFHLPRYGAGCAFWSLYTAMARPHMPEHELLVLPDGQMFEAFAIATYDGAVAASGLSVLQSTMAFRTSPGPHQYPAREVGPTCRICPRQTCPARREPSIHT